MIKIRLKKIFICVGALFMCAAQRFDPNTPIHIQSDTASYEHVKGTATHEGNVVLTQGQHQLLADKLTLKREGKDRIITATGNLATFIGKLDNEPDPIVAKAKILYYYPDKQLLVLDGMATLTHRQDKFQGPTLSYFLDKQVISANKQSNERPTIT